MRKNVIVIIGVVVGVIIILFISSMQKSSNNLQSKPRNIYRYAPVGDSYTIGNGLAEYERWPNILTENLKRAGSKIELVTNPAVSGWTTDMIRENQVSILKENKINVTTVLVGANDAFQDYPISEFKQSYQQLLNELEQVIPDKKILLITIPDYSNSPASAGYGNLEKETEKIKAYNGVIAEEGSIRGLPVVDIFLLSQQLATDSAMFIDDGLHPSGRQVEQWERLIFTEMKRLL